MDDLIVKEEQSLAPLADDTIIALAQRAEARVEAVKKIMQLALKITNERDWTLISGNPYMEASGGEKIAALFSLSWTINMNSPEYESYPDGHFMYSYKGIFTVAGKSIEVVGSRSSRDGFFKEYEYTPIPNSNQKQKKLIPPDRIDKGNVKKAAFTNLINNGIKRSLGLRNVTKEDLKAAGLDINKIKGYSHKQEEMSESGKSLIEKIEVVLIEMYGKDYGTQLVNLTENRDRKGKLWPGIKTLNGCSEAKLKVVYGQVKTAHDKWKKDNGKPSQPTPTTTDKPANKLVGMDSKEYEICKATMDNQTDPDRVDEILSTLGETFTEPAIKGLAAYALIVKKRF